MGINRQGRYGHSHANDYESEPCHEVYRVAEYPGRSNTLSYGRQYKIVNAAQIYELHEDATYVLDSCNYLSMIFKISASCTNSLVQCFHGFISDYHAKLANMKV